MRPIDADSLYETICRIPYTDIRECLIAKSHALIAIVEAPTVAKDTNVLDKWTSVKDSTPTVMGLNCWVIIKGCQIPMIDCWEGGRGEETTGVFPDGEKTFVKSGWYYNDCNEVTHWMPMTIPEPPEEVSET